MYITSLFYTSDRLSYVKCRVRVDRNDIGTLLPANNHGKDKRFIPFTPGLSRLPREYRGSITPRPGTPCVAEGLDRPLKKEIGVCLNTVNRRRVSGFPFSRSTLPQTRVFGPVGVEPNRPTPQCIRVTIKSVLVQDGPSRDSRPLGRPPSPTPSSVPGRGRRVYGVCLVHMGCVSTTAGDRPRV